MFAVHSSGEVSIYDKTILVPFGEYIPFRNYLGPLNSLVHKLTHGATDFSKGAAKVLKLGKYNILPFICYEAAFPGGHRPISKFTCGREFTEGSTCRSGPYKEHSGTAVEAEGLEPSEHTGRASILLNITNDMWFGSTTGPYQHMDMARYRAIEYGLPLIRVANTGISSVIDANGRVLMQTKLQERDVVDYALNIPTSSPSRQTLYITIAPYIQGFIPIFTSSLCLILYTRRLFRSISKRIRGIFLK
jgi:apolipoprotein N-acyltransferase